MTEEYTPEQIDREIQDFTSALVPFGWQDIKVAVTTALDAGHDGAWAAEQINDFIEQYNMSMNNIDPVTLVYESLLNEARDDIDNLRGIDIMNDTTEQISVYGNYMCTSLDYSEVAKKQLEDVINEIYPEDYTKAIEWLIEEADLTITPPKEEIPQ